MGDIIFYLALVIVYIVMFKNILFEIKHKLPSWLQKYWHILYCTKCVGLWLTLILSGSIYVAVITSAIIIMIEKYGQEI